jgi:hypothetical protein
MHFRSSHEDNRRADVPNRPLKGLHATNLTPALPNVSFNRSFHALPPVPAEVTSAPTTRARIQSKETPRTKMATAATSLREKPPPPEHRQHLHETIACIRQAPVTTERAPSVATASERRPSRTTRPRKVPLSGTGANSPRQCWTLGPRRRHGRDWDWERGRGGWGKVGTEITLETRGSTARCRDVRPSLLLFPRWPFMRTRHSVYD